MESVWSLLAEGGTRIWIQVVNTTGEATSSTKCHDFIAVHDGIHIKTLRHAVYLSLMCYYREI